jgi:hypothetical protein
MSEMQRDSHLILLEALDNERCLDARYRAVFSPPGRYVDYKVMQQVALRRRFGPLLAPALFILAALVPLLLLVQWMRALAASVRKMSPATGPVVWIFPTTPTNESLIRSGLAATGCGLCPVIIGNIFRELAPRLGLKQMGVVGSSTIRILADVLASRGGRIERLLHARDAVELLLLAEFARTRTEDVFATDDHYQRWSYVLSHSANDLRLVQHGILDDWIAFSYRGGQVRQLIARDESSAQTLRRYYASIQQTVLHFPEVELEANRCSDEAVFIASSFPTIDDEITFARALRQRHLAPIIVKLHPAHRYDTRKAALLELATHVCRPDENPQCRVFVSHSSSLELIYRARGVPTVSLQREGTVAAAVDAVVRSLGEGRISKSPFRTEPT